MQQTAKIFIATPCYGGMVTQEYMESVIACTSIMQTPMTLSLLGDDAMISRARNTLLHQFYTRSDASHILFIDADIGFPAEAPARLLAADKDVVAGMYPIKQHFWDKDTQENVLRGEGHETASLRYVGETDEMHQTWEKGPLLKTRYAGTGFMMISRKAIGMLIKSYPETAYRRIDAAGSRGETEYHALFDGSIDPETGTYLSEDFTFCRRWSAIGGEVWLDTSISLTHAGRASFRGDPSRRIGLAHHKAG
ncbi:MULTISPECIES: hypothetical protein [Acetobacter]|jgi:hypothetical protein|uniref:Glycosyl transferase n=1 Tax=Acetobacter peroxydans TaxID=104098 RepID=A0A4Y3TVI9_9PROT|nr:hypothetical protein [Acetobacter peroxydans]MCH4094501.1 hypothetical protein [Acetobacter peroxydans]MCH4142809.1 hypothetical protein [Acetobacter peroxydans]MCI1394284.1 hypothetical protein [Acetobacter peroxydans]MCI1411160.1 hypothetical protein [Acetobacter peroxydans]MCI1438862.1 hypothetical protein [Acetobacter peroxydans]